MAKVKVSKAELLDAGLIAFNGNLPDFVELEVSLIEGEKGGRFHEPLGTPHLGIFEGKRDFVKHCPECVAHTPKSPTLSKEQVAAVDDFFASKTGECCEKCVCKWTDAANGHIGCLKVTCPCHEREKPCTYGCTPQVVANICPLHGTAPKKIAELVEKHFNEAYELGRKHQGEIDAHNKDL